MGRPSASSPSRLRSALVVAAILLAGCGSDAVGPRGWVTVNKARRVSLDPDGVLFVEKDFHLGLQGNYRGYISMIANVFKEKMLFNLNATPLKVYMMRDLATYRRFGGVGEVICFDEREKSISFHVAGQPSVDAGQGRALAREIAHAVLHDMMAGKCPRWMDVGVVRFLANGAFQPDPSKKKDVKFSDWAWIDGPPDLSSMPLAFDSDLPSFEAVREASEAQFSAMGDKAVTVATAAVYLLREIEQLRNVIYETQRLSDFRPPEVLRVIRDFAPRVATQFKDPVKALFLTRPDFKVYLECLRRRRDGKLDDEVGVALLKNAEDRPDVGVYAAEYARFLLSRGKTSEALVFLEKSRACKTHRETPWVLRQVSAIHYAQKNWQPLRELVPEQLRTSIAASPRMFLVLAEALHPVDATAAKRHVELGLAHPPAGFESDVARLKELAAAWK